MKGGSFCRKSFVHALLLSCFLLLNIKVSDASSSSPSSTKTRFFKWDVEYIYHAPDCQESVVMGINGQFPGPTIRAVAGDTVIVQVVNKLSTEGVVIHWHGMRQFGSQWSDGAAGVTQCAINPGEMFEYKFIVDKAGTYFYHGHYGMQRSAGLYGSLIVDVAKGVKEPFHYNGEFSLLLSDWWHESVHTQEVGLSASPMRWIGEPQSLLINGRGQYNCSLAANVVLSKQYKCSNKVGISNVTIPQCKLTGNEQCAPQILQVKPNRTYRLRVASTTSLTSLNLAIENHKMTVVEADGNYVEPFIVDTLDIYSGEGYSVLFKTDQDPSKNYWISFGVRGRKPNTLQGLTILSYKPKKAYQVPTSLPPSVACWNDYNSSKSFTTSIKSLNGLPKPPMNSHRRLFLLNTQNKIGEQTKWAINNVSLKTTPTPYLGAIKYNLKGSYDAESPPETFPNTYDVMTPPINPYTKHGSGIYTFEFNTTVDVILQNANTLAPNTSEIHPWHLHGHDFWVLGYGDGKFKEGEDEKKFNLKNPPFRNTVVIFPFGWTALRFVADNPGVWFFHCHIEPHLYVGMGVVFAEGVNRLGEIPNNALTCGMTAKFLMNNNNK